VGERGVSLKVTSETCTDVIEFFGAIVLKRISQGSVMYESVLRIRIRIILPKADPDPHQSEKPDTKQDPDPDLHQSQNSGAVDAHKVGSGSTSK
jgi:hypothetical protein